MKGMENYAVDLLNKLRKHDIIVQAYLESGKMKKKFNYADKLNIPYVIVIGEDELKEEKYSLRDMKTGEQKLVGIDYLIENL